MKTTVSNSNDFQDHQYRLRYSKDFFPETILKSGNRAKMRESKKKQLGLRLTLTHLFVQFSLFPPFSIVKSGNRIKRLVRVNPNRLFLLPRLLARFPPFPSFPSFSVVRFPEKLLESDWLQREELLESD